VRRSIRHTGRHRFNPLKQYGGNNFPEQLRTGRTVFLPHTLH
jgi:hypothetical protein